MSETTKKMRIWRDIMSVLSFLILIGCLVTYICLCMSGSTTDSVDLRDELGRVGYSALITAAVLLVLLVVAGKKVRPFLWMICVILGAYLFDKVGMYITFGCWITDEYIIYALANHFAERYKINKEIDARE